MGDNTVSSNVVVINKKERINGWSWPLHPFQVVAWFFVVAIPFVYYGSIVSHLPEGWILVGCLVSLKSYRRIMGKILPNSKIVNLY